MESLFFNLLQVLNALNAKLQEMLAATEKHNLALRSNDMENIKAALKELDSISPQTKFLDNQREDIQRQLEAKLKLPQGATLSQTLTQAPEKLAGDLQIAAESLRQTTKAIHQLVELNNILTRQALNFNELMLKALKPTKATYNPTGQTNASNVNTSLLNKTI